MTDENKTTEIDTCDRCCGTGWQGHPDDPAGRCSQCNGTGGVPRTTGLTMASMLRIAIVQARLETSHYRGVFADEY